MDQLKGQEQLGEREAWVQGSPNTVLAIEAFERYAKASRVMEKRYNELEQAMARVPLNERPIYFKETEEIRKRFET